MPARSRDGYGDNLSTKHFPHLGEPPGLSRREARQWRRDNTYYIRQGETIDPEILADPPECFTPDEWEKWAPTVPLSGGFHLIESPSAVQGDESPAERLGRQARATRTAACEDCLLFYQLDQRRLGRCHPPDYAITPVKRLMESEHTVMEGTTDGTPEGNRHLNGATSEDQRIAEGSPEVT